MRTLSLFALGLALTVTAGCGGGDSAETPATGETATGETTAPTTAPTTPAEPAAPAVQNLSGTLAAGDTQLSSGEYYDSYPVQLQAGQTVVIDMNSEAIDPYLILRAPSGTQEDNDDHEGSTTHSRIQTTATETGEYTVNATTFTPNETGAYTLTITPGATP